MTPDLRLLSTRMRLLEAMSETDAVDPEKPFLANRVEVLGCIAGTLAAHPDCIPDRVRAAFERAFAEACPGDPNPFQHPIPSPPSPTP